MPTDVMNLPSVGIPKGNPAPPTQGPPSGFDYGNQQAPPSGWREKLSDPGTMQMAGLLGTIGGNIGSMFDAPGAQEAPKVFSLEDAKAHIDQLGKIEDRRKKNKMEEQQLAQQAQQADEQLAQTKAGHAVHYDPSKGLGYRQLTPQEIEQRYQGSAKGRSEKELNDLMQRVYGAGQQANGGPPQVGGTPPQAGNGFRAMGGMGMLPPAMAATLGSTADVMPPQQGGTTPQAPQGGPPDINKIMADPTIPPDLKQQIVQQIQQQQSFGTGQRQAEQKMQLEAAQEERARTQSDAQRAEIDSLNRYRDALAKKAEAEAEYTRKGKKGGSRSSYNTYDKALSAYEKAMDPTNPTDPAQVSLAKNNLLLTLDELANDGDNKAKALLMQIYGTLTPEEKQALLEHMGSED